MIYSRSFDSTGQAVDKLVLSGAEYNDTLPGGAGDQILIGGKGDDTYLIDSLGDIVREVTGEGADRVISTIDYAMSDNIEELDMSPGAYKGTGNALDNILKANDSGNDLSGGEGNDQLIGGKGNDHLKGGSGNDVVDAGAGDDEIVGGDGAGDDTYMGGEGVDTVRYTSAVTGITVDLEAGTASGNEIGNDILIDIENVIGGQSDDVITGSIADNVIDGYTGNDTIDGGPGTDTATYSGKRADYSIIRVSGGFIIADLLADDGNDGTDFLISIERVAFSDLTFNLVANNAPTGTVTITGNVIQGHKLTAANTLADADGLGTITYQWLADGAVISDATGSTLTLTQAQVGKAISVRASYTDGQGTAESMTSDATDVVIGHVNTAPRFAPIGGGKVTTDFGGVSDSGRSVVVQADGKILVAGSSWNGTDSDCALARYNPDGSLDSSFSGDGKVTTDFDGLDNWGSSVTVQADGK